MRVLVTGGTGYLGRAIVSALAARGHDLVVFARSAARSGLPGRPIDGDIRDAAAVERAAAGCDAISHSAALVSIWRRRREDFDDVNVGGLQNVLAAAQRHAVPRIVYTSSFLALPPRDSDAPVAANDYARTKILADRAASEAVARGVPLIRVYPGVVYGPGRLTEGNLVGRLIGDHLRRRLPGLVGADRKWSYAYVDDVAAGHCSALERGAIGARYALGGDNAPQRRVFEIVRDITGRSLPAGIPFPVADALGAIEEMRVGAFGGTPLITRGAVEIFRHDWSLDSTDAVRDLGYTMTPLADGIRRTVDSMSVPGEAAAPVRRVTAHSERARQWVHIGSAGFAVLLRWLTWQQAAAAAAGALAFNALLLPRLGGRRLYRDVDRQRGFPLGILLYPASVLLLVLVFRARLDIAAAAWGILAFGDGFATLAGGGPALPWNRAKSIRGTAAFVVCGGLAGVALAWWTRTAIAPVPPMMFVVVAPLAAAAVAALVESLPVRLDDNISVPLAAGAVLWVSSLMTADAIADSQPLVAARLPWAVGVNAVVALLGFVAGTVSVSGTVAGAIVGIMIWTGAGGPGWTLLFASFVAATAASRMGLEQKEQLGIGEERGGRRGAGNAIANCSVAAAAAVVAVTTPYYGAALFAFSAALVAGGSDTVASEIGKAWGRSTFLVTTLRRVPAGTPGAMSLEGTVAGIVAAFVLAVLASILRLITPSAILPVVVAASVGALVESALGATLEGPGILNNDMLNFINTAVAAAVALMLAA